MSTSPRRPGARIASWLPLLLLCLLSSAALAQETILQNDGFVDGQPVGFQGGFVAGESGAVRLQWIYHREVESAQACPAIFSGPS